MPRGGRRQGTPGKNYANRTDLAKDPAPSTGTVSPASGGMEPPEQTWQTPDDVPGLTDPTHRPQEDPTRGLNNPVRGPSPEYMNNLWAAYTMNPTQELKNAILFLQDRGEQ